MHNITISKSEDFKCPGMEGFKVVRTQVRTLRRIERVIYKFLNRNMYHSLQKRLLGRSRDRQL